MIFGALEFLAREIMTQAEKELYDPEKVHKEMTEAYEQMESGAISQEEFEQREQLLIERLEQIEARRRGVEGDEDEEDEYEDEDVFDSGAVVYEDDGEDEYHEPAYDGGEAA